jgi:hypothetical protein
MHKKTNLTYLKKIRSTINKQHFLSIMPIARSEATWRSPKKNLIMEIATLPSVARNVKKISDFPFLSAIPVYAV